MKRSKALHVVTLSIFFVAFIFQFVNSFQTRHSNKRLYDNVFRRKLAKENSKLFAVVNDYANPQQQQQQLLMKTCRREWIGNSFCSFLGFATVCTTTNTPANAADTDVAAPAEESLQVSEEELTSLYENPAQPTSPEETSGLVVLRVAEVAQFQEKILRAVASGELQGVKVAPMQFAFGTQILLKNSNLDGNMKLMIYSEIPKKERKNAIKNAVSTMNMLQDILKYSNSIQRDFENEEMIKLADMYSDVRVNLNALYEYLTPSDKEKYYGYFVAVTEYEKKIAEGTYNPDIDGILKFDK